MVWAKIPLPLPQHIVILHDVSALSKSHERIARAIWQCQQRELPAFVSDLVRTLGYAAESSLTATLRLMEDRGLIRIEGGGARGRSRVAALTSLGRRAIGVGGGLPLLGTIPAGPLTEALQDAETVETTDLLPHQEGDFLLRVRGDSMIGDGILDGDTVLLRPGVAWQPGEIAAVLVGETYESTLKRIFPSGEKVILRASNPQYPDLEIPAETVRIAGVFRGLIRHARGA
jgi:repressor LexA